MRLKDRAKPNEAKEAKVHRQGKCSSVLVTARDDFH